jgi:putative intracellular protease/amidase
MRNVVYLFVFDGFADWEAALTLCEIRRPGDYRVRTVGLDRRPVQSMGGLIVLPDIGVDEIEIDSVVLAIVPGGTFWERGEVVPISALLRRLHDAGATIGALCDGVLALAHAGLIDTRRHCANYVGHIETYVPDYCGGAHYDANALAVTDDRVITAGGVGNVDFAREVIRALDLYDERDTTVWYRLFRHGEPPPWFARSAHAEATAKERA